MIKLENRRLLVPIDFSLTSTKALIHAAALAGKDGGHLILLHVRRKTEPGRAQAMALSRLRNRLKNLAVQVSQRYGIPAQAVVIAGKCPDTIVKMATRYSADLIVMGTNGSDSDSSLFFGSNSERVVSHTPVPVLTVRSDAPDAVYRKILLPVDLSPHSRQKVNVALKLARQFGASLHMLGLLPRDAESERYKLQVIQRQVARLAKDHCVSFCCTLVLTNNPVAKTLAQARRLGAELIVSMTDEAVYSGLYLTGSFDRRLVNESTIPVLSIRPEVHEENIEPASLGGVW